MIASTIARNTSIFLLLFSLNATAQPIYTGQRLAIFGFEIAEVSERNINITCRVVNTGHLPVQLPADASQTVIELDSMNVPSLLDQRQADISAALAQKNLMLQPGAFKNDLNLRISIEAPVLETSTLPFPRACADLAFDTAYLVEYDGSNMRLRYILRNIGTAPVALFGEQGVAMTINAYFVSGQRITRGAIPAATTNLRMGRETLDGWLRPQQRLWGEMAFDLKNRTRFSPNVALELDPYLVTDECTRNNNTYPIIVEF